MKSESVFSCALKGRRHKVFRLTSRKKLFLYRIQNYIKLSKEYRTIINPSRGKPKTDLQKSYTEVSLEFGLRKAISLWLSIPLLSSQQVKKSENRNQLFNSKRHFDWSDPDVLSTANNVNGKTRTTITKRHKLCIKYSRIQV